MAKSISGLYIIILKKYIPNSNQLLSENYITKLSGARSDQAFELKSFEPSVETSRHSAVRECNCVCVPPTLSPVLALHLKHREELTPLFLPLFLFHFFFVSRFFHIAKY